VLAQALLDRGADVVLHDPYVHARDQNLAKTKLTSRFTGDLDAALEGADVIFLCTAHGYYQEHRAAIEQAPSAGIVDGCNLFDPHALNGMRDRYTGIGRGTKAPSAAALFGRASDLRHEGRLDQAIDTYRVLQQRYPRTREANLSYALAGRSRLERGRPAQALAEFDRYLKVDAEVTEEVLAWRTEALRHLGRRREEAAGWRLLLARFPGSIYAEQARSRLAALAP
jgi:tetratricopeptide (TPR) repeat protein